MFCLMLAVFTYWQYPALNGDQRALLEQLPFIVCGLAAFMALLANQSKNLGTAMTMLISYWLIRHFLQAPLNAEPASQIFSLISLCLPLILGVFIVLPDTGWRHPAFLVLTAFISIFALIIISLFQWQPLWFSHLLPGINESTFFGLKISATAGLLFLLVYTFSIILPLLRREYLDSSLPGLSLIHI